MSSQSISDRSRGLVDVALGRYPADLVIRNGRWVCVQSGEIIHKTDNIACNFIFSIIPPDI